MINFELLFKKFLQAFELFFINWLEVKTNLLLLYYGLSEDAREFLIHIIGFYGLGLGMLGNDVANICNFFNKFSIFIWFFLLKTIVEKFQLKILSVLMLPLNKRSEDSAFCELIPKGTNFTHSQIRKKVLNFKNIIQELWLSKT